MTREEKLARRKTYDAKYRANHKDERKTYDDQLYILHKEEERLKV